MNTTILFCSAGSGRRNALFRAVAIARKNYLFCGSDAGGRTAAMLFTMTQTCRRLCLDPFAYLQDVLMRVQNSASDDLASFLPRRWVAAQAC